VTPRPTATIAPTVRAYPACTPIPGTPTITRTPIPQETPQPASALGDIAEVGATAGKNTGATLATDPGQGLTVVGWIAWGAGPDEYVGDVWVRVLGPLGQWSIAQSVNTAPVKKAGGGLGLAILPEGVIVALYGAGGMNGDRNLYLVESRDAGQTWSLPAPLPVSAGGGDETPTLPSPTSLPGAATSTPTSDDGPGEDSGIAQAGGVLALRVDPAGGLHLLFLARDPFRLGYGYRAPGQTTWQIVDRLTGGTQRLGALAILPLRDGSLRRFVLAPDGDSSRLSMVTSDDGRSWRTQTLQTDRFLGPEVIYSVSVIAATRPDGSAFAAAAWGQYSRGGVFASVSLDGQTWGPEEPVALHQSDGACYDSNGGGLPCGYQPSLAYDPGSDKLAVAWVEIVRKREPAQRTRLAARDLDPAGTWRFVVTPETRSRDDAPQLTEWGQIGTLVSSPDNQAHWQVVWETRNKQYRVYAQPVGLSALLVEGTS
jgi:hypothetical protein